MVTVRPALVRLVRRPVCRPCRLHQRRVGSSNGLTLCDAVSMRAKIALPLRRTELGDQDRRSASGWRSAGATRPGGSSTCLPGDGQVVLDRGGAGSRL